MYEYSTFQAFRPHFDALARVGYFKAVLKPETKWQKKLHDCFRAFVWMGVLAYNVQYMTRAIKYYVRFLALVVIRVRNKTCGLEPDLLYSTYNVLKCLENGLESRNVGSILILGFPLSIPMYAEYSMKLKNYEVQEVRHRTDQLIETVFLLLSTLNALGKQLTYNFRVRRIDKIIETINSPLFAPKNNDHETLIKVNVKFMSLLLAVCHIGTLTCCVLYSVSPFVEKLLGYEVVLKASFPFDTKKFTPFLIANSYMGILICMQGYGQVTMDCVMVAFYACVRNQLQLFRYDLEHLMDDFKLRKRNLKYVDDDDEYRKILHDKIVACFKHYDKIVWFAREVQSIFNEVMVMQFFVTTWVICMTVYIIVELPLFTPTFFFSISYLCCILGQLFMYCYIGTHLKIESGLVNDSIYQSDWLSMSRAFRRYLLILMERCKREIEPRGAFIIPMSLNTYISVLRSSYALFTILNRTE